MSENLKCLLGLLFLAAPFAGLLLYSVAAASGQFSRKEENHEFYKDPDHE